MEAERIQPSSGLLALRTNPVVALGEWVLRGIGQVMFQNSWLTGLIFLVGIFWNSWVYGIACILGTLVSTLTALALKADRELVRSGLFGFNGALVGIGLNAYLSSDFTNGNLPGWHLYLYIIFAGAFTSVVFSALGTLLGPYRVPALTAPFVITGWLFLFAVLRFSHLEPGPLLKATLPEPAALRGTTAYSFTTVYEGIGKGVAEVFFQDNWITGYIFLVALLVNSRISAAMALIGSAVGAGVAMILGASEETVRLGLYGFNPVLTAIALGGFFYVLTWQGCLYTLFGAVVTAWVWATVSVLLAPMGMPTFTSPFVIVTWLMIMAKDGFKAVVPILPSEATTPEENLARWRRSQAGAAASE